MTQRSEAEWEHLFDRVGANEPKKWAEYERQEELGNLVRMAFLRKAFGGLPNEDVLANKVQDRERYGRQSDLLSTFEEIEAAGVPRELLLSFARAACKDYLWHVIGTLEDDELPEADLTAAVHWGFWEETEDGRPRRRLDSISDVAYGIDAEYRDV